MFSTTDTIVAIATPQGRGAIGIVRLSGPVARDCAATLLLRKSPLEARHATLSRLVAGTVQDDVVVTFFPGPASYTGEDVVEIAAHGSGVVLNQVLAAAINAGARLAAPGEFTLRAYLNGRIDLAQAEAVADLIDAVTPLQARAAFDQLNGTLTSAITEIDAALFDLIAKLEASVDFPDEGYHFVEPDSAAVEIESVVTRIDELLSSAARGRLIREGAQIVIAGRPNAGKSSLFNALVGAHRAIVTDIPGTTRDLLTEVVDLNGLRATLVDTAGLAESADPIEVEGIRRARSAASVSDLILHVCDGTESLPSPDNFGELSENKTLIVSSKADLPAAWHLDGAVRVSARTGEGLDELIARIHTTLACEDLTDTPSISNVRHIDLLARARAALIDARAALTPEGGAMSEEFVLADLQRARVLLEEVTGRRTTDDVLAHVFERFCVGK
jgi:tRNA modification GTPase